MSQNGLKPNQSSSSEEASGSEDEYTSATESDDSDSGDKQKQVTAPPQSANKPQPPDPDSSSSEPEQSGSETDSDSDTDSDPPLTKPMENLDSKLVKNNGSKTASAPSKRPPPAPAVNQNDAKKPKIQILLNRNTANGELKKPQAPDLSSSEPEESSSETDSGSDADSDSPPKTTTSVDPNVKPTSSKPIDEKVERNLEPRLAKKDGSKMASSSPVKSKRPAPSPTANEKDAKKAKPNQSEPEESGSDSDTESDSPPKKPSAAVDNNIKPTASKLMDRGVERKVEPKLAKKEATKAMSKQHPQKSKGAEEDSKKQLFQRLWSEDDEIAILEGMIGYKTEKDGANPIAEIGAFHEFIKKSLHVEVSNTQLADKIRRLKKKYMTNVNREKDGKEISFSKSHEQKGYELSKLIWGSSSSNNSRSIVTVSKKKGTAASTSTTTTTTSAGTGIGTGTGTAANVLKSNGVDGDDDAKEKKAEVERMDISRFVKYGGGNGFPVLPEEIVKAGMELVDGPRRAVMEAKWKKLMEEELVLYVKRMELLKEQAQLVLEAIGSSRN